MCAGSNGTGLRSTKIGRGVDGGSPNHIKTQTKKLILKKIKNNFKKACISPNFVLSLHYLESWEKKKEKKKQKKKEN